jgi:hypothetical protein
MNVRFEGNNGHDADSSACPLMTRSGHPGVTESRRGHDQHTTGSGDQNELLVPLSFQRRIDAFYERLSAEGLADKADCSGAEDP